MFSSEFLSGTPKHEFIKGDGTVWTEVGRAEPLKFSEPSPTSHVAVTEFHLANIFIFRHM